MLYSEAAPAEEAAPKEPEAEAAAEPTKDSAKPEEKVRHCSDHSAFFSDLTVA